MYHNHFISIPKRMLALLLCMTLLLSLCGCQNKKAALPQKRTMTYLEYFDTVSLIVGYEDDEEQFSKVCEGVRSVLEEYHQLSDIYHTYDGINNVKSINDAAGESPVKVDRKLIDLLLYAKEMNENTDGLMNIAMGSVLSIWHRYRDDGINHPEDAKLPPMEKLQAAAEHTNIEDMIIDEKAGTVFLQDPDMSLDLGALAKGYAVERAAEYMESLGITGYSLNIGGNVRTLGTKPDGSDWIAGIENPDQDKKDSYIATVKLNDLALVTSGNYQRYYEVDHVRYHHIIDPNTLMPENYFNSVSILTHDSGYGDSLSTAVFNMSLEDGMTFIDSLDDVEALWSLNDGSVVYTDGFEAYLLKK